MAPPPHDEPLGRHPLGEDASPALQRMQASLKRRMFGGAPPNLGRFEILDVLGRGGMGVVYRARDPKLDRTVAIKVVRPGSATTGERLASEARRLARLSHPNIVIIHEVGDLDGEVFLVMELLDGGSLRDWLSAEPRHWRDALRTLLEAGRGLAAAHDLGLVHRDFKPDNVLIGDDGRPRVVDFGLTREVETDRSQAQTTSADATSTFEEGVTPTQLFSGTPAYLAPEQRHGTASPLSDQYAFCVVLHEALVGRRPGTRGAASGARGRPPAAVLRAVRRGLAAHPSDRFEDMTGLLRALERAANRRLWFAGAAAFVGTASLLAASAGQSPEPTIAAEPVPCVEAKRLAEALRQGQPRTSDAKLQGQLSAYLEAGATMIDETCASGALDAQDNLALACTRRHLLQLGALHELHDDGTLGEAEMLRVTRQLPAPAACADPVRLANHPALPADPDLAAAEQALRDAADRARMLRVGGADAEARDLLKTALESSLELPSLGARAEIQLELARLDHMGGKDASAVDGLRTAIITAERAGHGHCRAAAQIELGALLSNTGDFKAARDELDRAEATIERLGHPHDLEADIARERGFVALRAGKPADAIEPLRRSIALDEAEYGPDTFALIGSLNVLGAALAQTGQLDEAADAFERVRDLLLDQSGPDHPLLGRVLNNLGQARLQSGALKEGREQLLAALSTNERNLGSDHPSTIMARYNLALAQVSLGENETGAANADRALADAERVFGADSPDLRIALSIAAEASGALGECKTARARLARSDGLITKAWGDEAPQFIEVSAHALSLLSRCKESEAFTARQAHTQRILDKHGLTPNPSVSSWLATPAP
jgi:tetratricopeptide (TPR) repeat protein/tRNA A-37 threonylcarbamoyl transferase component Bud32